MIFNVSCDDVTCLCFRGEMTGIGGKMAKD